MFTQSADNRSHIDNLKSSLSIAIDGNIKFKINNNWNNDNKSNNNNE